MGGINYAMVNASCAEQKEYTMDTANAELRRLVPESVLVKAVYHPMAMMELVYNLTEAMMDSLAANKVSLLKKNVREMRELNREYKRELFGVEEQIVIDTFLDFYKDWYDQKVLPTIESWVYAYQRLVMNTTQYSGNTANFLAIMLVTNAIVKYCDEYDQEMTEQMRSYLEGSGLRWGYTGNSYIHLIEPMVRKALVALGVDPELRDANTEVGLGVFKNCINSILITLVDLKAEDKKFETKLNN